MKKIVNIILSFTIGISLFILVFIFGDTLYSLLNLDNNTLNVSRKDAFRTTARLMITTTKVLLHQNSDKVPREGTGTYFMLSELDLNNVIIKACEDKYDIHNSYIVVINNNGNLEYYVTLNGKNMRIDLAPESNIVFSDNNQITKVDNIKIDNIPIIK